MSNIHILYTGNNCTVDLTGLHNTVTGDPVGDATMTITLLDASGARVGGADWPQPMALLRDSTSTYRATLPYTLALVAGARYTAHIEVVAGNGLHAEWDLPCVGRARA